jgi:hypothetical protein
MDLANLYRELVRRNRVLAALGAAHLVLFVALAVLALGDTHPILGVNRWFKPMKFALSIGVYSWTLAWLTGYLPAYPRAIRLLSAGIAVSMIVEIVCIVGQPARGQTSHFNVATPLDSAIFSLMGVMILLNTLCAAGILALFFGKTAPLPGAVRWGIRLGLAIFLAASLEGGLMAARRAHGVGVPDGGPGLPFLNWSTQGGDLRASHFVGLHALQAVPLAALFFHHLRGRAGERGATAWTFGFAIIYAGVVAFLFFQAMSGTPLLALAGEAPS